MPKFIVPVITSYYEYYEVTADNKFEAIAMVKDGDGEEVEPWREFREVIDIQDHAVEEVTDKELKEARNDS